MQAIWPYEIKKYFLSLRGFGLINYTSGCIMRIKKGVLICLFSLACFFALAKSDLLTIIFMPNAGSPEDNTKVFVKRHAGEPSDGDVGQERMSARSTLAPISVPPIPLELIGRRLLATFQVDDVELASAVIYTEGYGAYRYRVGGDIPEGALLLAIEPASVLIEQDGQVFSLSMDLAGTPSLDPEEGSNTSEADAEDSEPEYFSRFSEEAKKFIDQFDLRPVRENFPEGYIIGDKFTELGVDYLGIQPGDIVLSVNGYPVGEYESDYLVWLSFRSTQKASVVIRGEQGEFTIHYPEEVFIKQPPPEQ